MVTRTLWHLVWRNRYTGLPWLFPMYLGWTEVARRGGDVTWLMVSSMVVAFLLGPGFVMGLDSREIRVLPLTHRDRWVTTWLLSTVVVTSYLFVVKSLIIILTVVIRNTVLMSPETLLLSTAYDFAYASALLPIGTLLNAADLSWVKRQGRRALSAWVILFAPYTLAVVILPFFAAKALPVHVSEFTIGHVLVLVFGLTMSLGGLRWTPRVFGSIHYHVNARGTTLGRLVTRQRFGDRFTGVARILWTHATGWLRVMTVGVAAIVTIGAFLPLSKDGLRFLSVMFLLLALMGISMVSPWAPWARRLKVLPLSVTHVNALVLLTPLFTWVEIWILLLLAHAALGLPIGEELGPFAVLAYGGVSAVANALAFKVHGSRRGLMCVSLLPAGAPLYVETLRHVPHEWTRLVLLLVGLFSLTCAAIVNHRTLTRSTSGSLVYQRPH